MRPIGLISSGLPITSSGESLFGRALRCGGIQEGAGVRVTANRLAKQLKNLINKKKLVIN